MIIRKSLSFKSLAHKAACLPTVSAKAALGGMMVTGEIPTVRPTVAIASLTTGVSAASIRKTLKVSAFERAMLVGGGLTLGDLVDWPEPAVGNDNETVAAEQTILAEQVLAYEKRLLEPPRMTVDDLLDVYMAMSPSEQIAFGRAIGVERVWLPRQRFEP
jgi:hypothetical protein